MKFFILGTKENRDRFISDLQSVLPHASCGGSKDFKECDYLSVSLDEAKQLRECYPDTAITLTYVSDGQDKEERDRYNTCLRNQIGPPGNLVAGLEILYGQDVIEEYISILQCTKEQQELLMRNISKILEADIMVQNKPDTLQIVFHSEPFVMDAKDVSYDIATGYIVTDEEGTKALLYALFQKGIITFANDRKEAQH